MVEFVEGKVIESYKPYAKIHVYFKIVDFLKYIGKNLTDTEKKRISKRTPLQYILLYPLLVFNSFFVNPDAMPYVIAGVPKFVSLVPIMLKNSELELVHRDLHFINISRHKKGYALVDFQQCVYTEPLHELITTLRYWWKLKMGDTFDKLLLKELVNKNKDRENFLQLFQVYGINSVTHGLTGEFSKKIINGWIDFLKFCLNPNFYEYTKT